MKNNKISSIIIIVFALCQISFIGRFANAEMGASGFVYRVNERATQQFSLRPPSELSKILYLLDLFKGTDLQIIYEGIEYEPNQALRYSRDYVRRNYNNEKAETWIKQNAAKSEKTGQLIYLKNNSGDLKPLHEVLISELEKLEKK